MQPLDLILCKRSGGELSDEQIRFFVSSVVGNAAARDRNEPPPPGTITDAQIGAFLMAVYHHGLSPRELATLTSAMRSSGEVFDATPLHATTVDKHSTGGVGDKTSLLLAPIVAAAGLARPNHLGTPSIVVPMISGRSLGHTGGTLDKLETIPGFNTQLSLAQFADVLRRTGACLIGQTPALVPADRLLYALRDHTGTVESPFLITASIMSKKLAESLDALVLDVKVGSGAFLPTLAQARELATLMVDAGNLAGTRTVALLTSMDQPLGRFAGNWLEVAECVSILQNQPHPLSADLIELTHTLAGTMLHLAGAAPTPQAGQALSADLLSSGAAYRAWLEIVEAQGGDTSVFTAPRAMHPAAATRTLTASRPGFLHHMDCTAVGWAVQRLGAGRTRPGAPVSAAAGIELHCKLGDRVEPGQPLVTLFADDAALLDEPEQLLRDSLHLDLTPPASQPLVHDIISATASRN